MAKVHLWGYGQPKVPRMFLNTRTQPGERGAFHESNIYIYRISRVGVIKN